MLLKFQLESERTPMNQILKNPEMDEQNNLQIHKNKEVNRSKNHSFTN